MRNLTLDNISDIATASLAGLPDARQRELMQQLVQHLHAYAKTVRLTRAEIGCEREGADDLGRADRCFDHRAPWRFRCVRLHRGWVCLLS